VLGVGLMKQKSISGLIVPLITPMNDDYSLDTFSLKTHVARLMNKGVKNLFLLGSFAEQEHILLKEEKEIIKTINVLAGKRTNILIGCIAKSTEEIISKVLFAQKFSEYCVVNVPFPALTNEVLFIDFFDKLFTRTKAKIILVNDPFYFKRNIPIIGLERIINWEKLIGIIDYSSNPGYYKALLDHYQSIKVFQGKEELIVGSHGVHTSGVVPILSNLMPSIFVNIEQEFNQNRFEKMLKKQEKINSVLVNYFPASKRIQSIKYALLIEGVIQKFFSQSLKELSEKEEEKIELFFEKSFA
jgi:dihydrodipicolinate synthase/N-acetylneuraminate lyase